MQLLANPAGGDAASLSYDGYTIGFRLSGVDESNGTASGSELTFPSLTNAASESYRVLSAGLEQSISLASSAAPNAFTCEVSHSGLTLKQDKTGAWGFYEPGKTTALLELSQLLVYDSSKNAAGLPDFLC